MSDTKSFVLCLAVGATFAMATLYQHCAKAAELPVESICHIKAELAYEAQAALLSDADASGEDTSSTVQADQVYGDTLESCEWDESFGQASPVSSL